LIIRAGEAAKVPAGQALAVDRLVFSRFIEDALNAHPGFTREDGEVGQLPEPQELVERNEAWIVATGPLTSTAMTQQLEGLSPGSKRLFFYDAIAPIIDTDSIDMGIAFRASRYDKQDGDAASGDYLNLPMSRDEYEA